LAHAAMPASIKIVAMPNKLILAIDLLMMVVP
jgi:hypothetical protein